MPGSPKSKRTEMPDNIITIADISMRTPAMKARVNAIAKRATAEINAAQDEMNRKLEAKRELAMIADAARLKLRALADISVIHGEAEWACRVIETEAAQLIAYLKSAIADTGPA